MPIRTPFEYFTKFQISLAIFFKINYIERNHRKVVDLRVFWRNQSPTKLGLWIVNYHLHEACEYIGIHLIQTGIILTREFSILCGVGRIRTSGLQRPRLASYHARQRPLSCLPLFESVYLSIILSLLATYL